MNRLFEHDVDLRKTDPTARCLNSLAFSFAPRVLPFVQFSVGGAAHCCRSAPSTIDSTKLCLLCSLCGTDFQFGKVSRFSF